MNLKTWLIRSGRLVLAGSLGLSVSWIGSGLNARETTFQNPILPGFHPDPSICRVGEDYYLVNSSFEFFPGIPIYRSRDLVNWQPIGHVLDRPEQLDLDQSKNSGGLYAPTIRYHAGTYYMINTHVDHKIKSNRNFIVTATDPAGPWSLPHWIAKAPGIDPSLFFDDDGKCYYSGQRGAVGGSKSSCNIYVQEIDLDNWKLVGSPVDVVEGPPYEASHSIGAANNMEGAHLYKKEGYYYVLVAHGGTGVNHAESIWRSKQIFGPYEGNPANPIETNREADHPPGISSTGHADLVQTPKGDWWMVLLGKRSDGGESMMGRETFLVPVDWSGPWPVVNPRGKIGRIEFTYPRPDLPEAPVPSLLTRDDFAAPKLGFEWNFLRTPRETWWSTQSAGGGLTLKLRPDKVTDPLGQPSFIGRRIGQRDFVTATALAFTPQTETEAAGLVLYRANDVVVQLLVVSARGQTKVQLREEDKVVAEKDVPSGKIVLQAVGDPAKLTFSYRAAQGQTFQELGTLPGSKLATGRSGRFTGSYAGLYASSNGAPSTNSARFEWFTYSDSVAHPAIPYP